MGSHIENLWSEFQESMIKANANRPINTCHIRVGVETYYNILNEQDYSWPVIRKHCNPPLMFGCTFTIVRAIGKTEFNWSK